MRRPKVQAVLPEEGRLGHLPSIVRREGVPHLLERVSKKKKGLSLLSTL
jgi:hypothetical protein